MRWSYKTIHYELKKDGILGSSFLDESEIELSLNQYGKAGWELVSLLETLDGLIAIFKQPLDLDARSVSTPSKISQKTPEKAVAQDNITIRKKSKIDVDLNDNQDSGVEDVAEAILLDEFEVDADLKRNNDEIIAKTKKTRKKPIHVGQIRIE